jgi:capsule polysaccharide export protein KpsE/RkpR
MAKEFSFQGAVDLLRVHRRTFVIVGALAVLLSSIFSAPFFIKPKYLSSATVYPVNLNPYSTETRTDQLLQLLESNSLRDSLIKQFDLARVYEIDTTQNGAYFFLYNEFTDRVAISKTRYESVMIEILDEDPVRARDMVVAMLDQTNLLARRLQREKSREQLRIAEGLLANEQRKVDSVENRVVELRKKAGVLVYESQSAELTRGYVRMLSTPGISQARLDEVQGMFRNLEDYGGEVRALMDMGNKFRNNHDRLLGEYERLQNDVIKELTYTNVILYPEVSDKKAYPVRWLIVLVATASALFLCFVLLMWREEQR